ncbi:hypothetical protein Tco_0337091 [Tanacetum coccineum]
MFKQLHVNILLADALNRIPKYQKMLKSLISNKEKLLEMANTPVSENYSAVILKKLLKKLGNPGKFLIPCGFNELKCKALADLANYSPSNDLVDTIPEMFSDEHTLDYSSPPLWDDKNLFDLEPDNDYVYDDPFDSKEEKIKESKLLIDELNELDPPRSSNLLAFPECNSVFYEDFSKVDALSSTNNEDKIFNPGILIHENLFEVTNHATMEKNVKKATNASLILEDLNPSLCELPFHKEVPGLRALL